MCQARAGGRAAPPCDGSARHGLVKDRVLPATTSPCQSGPFRGPCKQNAGTSLWHWVGGPVFVEEASSWPDGRLGADWRLAEGWGSQADVALRVRTWTGGGEAADFQAQLCHLLAHVLCQSAGGWVDCALHLWAQFTQNFFQL